jgi:hypothetical protein
MSETLIPDPGVFFELNTFEPLEERGDEVADWLEQARRRLVDPLLAVVDPGRRRVILAESNRDLRIEAVQEDSPETWERALENVRAGRRQELSLTMSQLDAEGTSVQRLPPIRLVAELAGLEFEGAAHRLFFVAGRPLYGSRLTEETQAVLLATAKEAAVRFEACTGYVTLDYAGRYSPYELSIGRRFVDGLRECGEFVRGYYWGNFLSREHVERLGGISAIERDAPCAVVEVLASDPPLLYLQLTKSLDAFDDEELKRLRTFFLPVLPEVDRQPVPLEYPLRIVPAD